MGCRKGVFGGLGLVGVWALAGLVGGCESGGGMLPPMSGDYAQQGDGLPGDGTGGTAGGGGVMHVGSGGAPAVSGDGDGSGGAPAVSGDGDGLPPIEDALPKPACLKNANQVVLIGDSYINWVSHTFPADLNALAGEQFRMYAIGAYSMGSGGLGEIPPQLDTALAEDPDITTIVMTGGGNDILVPDTVQFPRGGDCKMSLDAGTIPDCQAIVETAIDAADRMMEESVSKIRDDIVVDVIYFFYPNVPDGTLVGGTYPNAMLEYALPKVKDFCDGVYERSGERVNCHFVDLRPVFEGHPEYFAPTDIHPNLAGSAAMADAVWQTMVDNCVAQPESSGCCAP